MRIPSSTRWRLRGGGPKRSARLWGTVALGFTIGVSPGRVPAEPASPQVEAVDEPAPTPAEPTREPLAVVRLGGPTTLTADAVRCFRDDPVRRVVRVENPDGPDRSIDGLHATCGCTAASITTRELPTGGSAEITVDIKTSTATRRTVNLLCLIDDDTYTVEIPLEVSNRFEPTMAEAKIQPDETTWTWSARSAAGRRIVDVAVRPANFEVEALTRRGDGTEVTIRCVGAHRPTTAAIEVTDDTGSTETHGVNLMYVGRVAILPRRPRSVDGRFQFYVRGDVDGMAGADVVTLRDDGDESDDGDDQSHTYPVEVRYRQELARVIFTHDLPAGTHRVTATVGTASFPLQLTVP